MMRREAARRIGGFREPFPMGEDFDFLLRLSEIGTMANLAERLYVYRLRLSSVCAMLGPRWAAYRDAILELARERARDGLDRLQRGQPFAVRVPDEGTDAHALAVAAYLRWSEIARRAGHRAIAWRYAAAAVAAAPASRPAWKSLARLCLPGAGR
jgi:GT2 family glycosyltransferase